MKIEKENVSETWAS